MWQQKLRNKLEEWNIIIGCAKGRKGISRKALLAEAIKVFERNIDFLERVRAQRFIYLMGARANVSVGKFVHVHLHT